VRLDVADAEHLEAFQDSSFDAVFSFSTVRFCQSQTGALREFVRVARPGAPVVVDFPNANCPWYGPLKRSLKIDPHIHDRLFLPREAEGLLRDSGLRQVTSHPMLFTTKRAPDPLLPLFQAVDAIGERMPGIRGLAGIIMARGVKSDAR
jgi:SAM-dependent methyltransferase